MQWLRAIAPRETGGAWHDYYRRSSSPWASLVFLAPWLLVYESARAWQGAAPTGLSADGWLRAALGWVGFAEGYWLPLMLVSVLLCWQVLDLRSWNAGPRVATLMALECAAWALAAHWALAALVPAGQGGARLLAVGAGGQETFWSTASVDRMTEAVGAGLYEETLFRLMALPLLAALLRRWGFASGSSWLAAVLMSSALFAVAHVDVVHGWKALVAFGPHRFVAGVFFASLFRHRGFGVAVGTHTLYDQFATLCG